MYDKWSLDVLYSDFTDERFTNDLNKMDALIATMHEATKTLGTKDVKETLSEGLKLSETYAYVSSRLINYCSLRQSTNTSDADTAAYMGQLLQKNNETIADTTLFEKYVASVENLEEVIKSDEFLSEYKDRLLHIKDSARYMLNEDVESALSRMDLSGGTAWSDLQSYLTSSLKVDYNGEETTLSAIRNMAYSSDSEVRKKAYEAELRAYEQIKDSIAFSLNSIKMQAITEANMRGFDSHLDKVLYHSRMKRETLEALLEAIREYSPNLQGYLRAKAEAFGHKNGLPWYDLFAPIGNNVKTYSVEEAKSYLMDIFNSQNPKMAEIVERAFEEKWIDFFPRKGKVGGAFCAGLDGEKEFRVLTNYDGSFSDIVTLAHELGHGYHNFMIFDNRPLNMDYSMPVAETASTFNENIVINYAIDHANDDNEKLSLLEGQLSDLTQIICDIHSRYLFESKVVENRSSRFMFADDLCKLMLEAQKEAYGDGLDHDCLHPYMWVCKGHYYSAGLGFYNFPYAFGGLFARGLYEKFKTEGPSFLEKYNYMLKETPVRSVEDVAKICDIDLTCKEFWLMSLHSYDEAINEFKRLVKQ